MMRELLKIIDENIRSGREKLVPISQSVCDSAGHNAGEFSRPDIRITVPDHDRACRRKLKLIQDVI
jgi:hypothetical protein